MPPLPPQPVAPKPVASPPIPPVARPIPNPAVPAQAVTPTDQPHRIFQQVFYATGCIFELARGVIVFAVILALFNVFIGTINVVNGQSMEPNFHNGQYVVVDKISYLNRQPKRGEAIILKFPGDPEKTRYIKRIVGLPGEKIGISNSQISINGKLLPEGYIPKEYLTQPDMEKTMGPDEYFVMGDNRENSNDSRVFGGVERRFIIGIAYFVLWPANDDNTGLVPPQYYTSQ